MKELDRLKEQIVAAKEAYYTTGKTIMSDAEYDALVARAEKLGYIETVGSKPVGELPEINHEHPMLSLDKVHTPEETAKFCGDHEVVAMYKADGLTVSATYEDGVLVRLETRGDGQVGNDIMCHAGSFKNLPLTIDFRGRYVVDGEAVILNRDFEMINSKLPDGQEYKNARNLAAGTLNLLDPAVSAKRHLRFYVWDVIEGNRRLLTDSFSKAESLGFDVISYAYVSELTANNIEEIVNMMKEEARDDGFPIDGVVFKFNDLDYGRSLGYTGHHGRGAIAYKYQDETYPTKLRSITWQVGKTGKITPVANFDPVIIDGTVVERASLHNISVMRDLGPTVDCTCYVAKKNQIIPQVESCDDDGVGEFLIPGKCPVCGGKTEISRSNNTDNLVCVNDDCPGKLLGKLKQFVSKKGMDIDGLSEATLDRFIDLGWLGEFIDIFSLVNHRQQMINLDGFGKKSADKLLAAIEASRHSVKLPNFITALSIPGIGEMQAKLICKTYPTWDEFWAATESGDFSQIGGIGDVLNANIHDWFRVNYQHVDNLVKLLDFEDGEIMNPPETSSRIAGMNFVITGTLSHFKNRDELVNEIEKYGGKVVGSVSKKTDYLINNDVNSNSSKNLKARELGIPIISEAGFLDMIGGSK